MPDSTTRKVAPHAGAWIETASSAAAGRGVVRSHPTRVRGLKHLVIVDDDVSGPVAPHAGAWIETCSASPS